MEVVRLVPRSIQMSHVAAAIREGWRCFRAAPRGSAAYASVAVLIGFGLLTAVGRFGISPMSIAFAGGFMLVAPAMLTGFFRIALTLEQGGETRIGLPFSAFFQAPPTIWVVAVFCTCRIRVCL